MYNTVYNCIVYNSTIHHLYFVLCSPPQVTSFSIIIYPPFTVIYLLPPPFPSGSHPCCLCLWFFLFVCLINLFTFFTQLPNSSSLWQLSVCSLYLWICFYFVCEFILFIRMKSYDTYLSLIDFFHLTQYSLGPSILSQKVGVPSFLPSSSSPLCKCTTAFLSAHLLMGFSQILAIVNNAALNIGVYIFFCFWEYIWRNPNHRFFFLFFVLLSYN